jgi:hypothetical protein
MPSEEPEGFTLEVGIPISHLREVDFHYIFGQLSQKKAQLRYWKMMLHFTGLLAITKML